MKVANLTEAKNDLSRLVERVRRGERVRILVRGIPAADLVPVEGGPADARSEQAELADLERKGMVRRGAGGFPAALRRPGPRVKGGRAVEILLEERRRGR